MLMPITAFGHHNVNKINFNYFVMQPEIGMLKQVISGGWGGLGVIMGNVTGRSTNT